MGNDFDENKGQSVDGNYAGNSTIIKETIKKKRHSKHRFLRKTMVSVLLSIIFGAFACFTFLFLQPYFSEWLYPTDEEQEIIVLPAEIDEVAPEDMLQEEEIEIIDESIQPVVFPDLTETDYMEMQNAIRNIAEEAIKSVVTVSGVTSDVDWFDNSYENNGTAAGVIVAKGTQELLILVSLEAVESAEQIRVKFCDDTEIGGRIKGKNETLGYAVVTVPYYAIDETTRDIIQLASWGTSNGSSLAGTAVIALGAPDGHLGSIVYGNITSSGVLSQNIDKNVNMIRTDIYGSKTATGILVNYKGQMIGLIHQSESTEDMQNLIEAVGISDIRDITEMMSNAKSFPVLGIYGMDVSDDAYQNLGVPYGAFVTEVVMDSPAMMAGIQSGDVIVGVGSDTITYFSDMTKSIYRHAPEDVVELTIERQNGDGYEQIKISVQLSQLGSE